MFGKKFHMFTAQPNNLNNTNNKEATMNNLDLYKIEMLLTVCRDYYIVDTSVDISISVQYSFGKFSQLKQR